MKNAPICLLLVLAMHIMATPCTAGFIGSSLVKAGEGLRGTLGGFAKPARFKLLPRQVPKSTRPPSKWQSRLKDAAEEAFNQGAGQLFLDSDEWLTAHNEHRVFGSFIKDPRLVSIAEDRVSKIAAGCYSVVSELTDSITMPSNFLDWFSMFLAAAGDSDWTTVVDAWYQDDVNQAINAYTKLGCAAVKVSLLQCQYPAYWVCIYT